MNSRFLLPTFSLHTVATHVHVNLVGLCFAVKILYYHIASFVYEVLFLQILQDVVGSQIFILQLHLYLHFNSVIVACVTVPYLVVWLTFVSLQVLQESRHFNSALLQCLLIWKALKNFFHQGNHPALFQCNLTKHPCKHSDHIAYCIGFCFRCHCTCRIWQFLNQARAGHRLVCAWFLKIILVRIVSMHMCVCVYPCPRLLITSGMMWCDMDLIWLITQVLQLLFGNVAIIVNGWHWYALWKLTN